MVRINLTNTPATPITITKAMTQPTEPVFKLILAVGFGGLLLIVLGILDRRDLLTLAGAIVVASALHTIAKLVK